MAPPARILGTLAFSVLLAACGAPSTPSDILDQSPRGHVQGVPWAMTSAVVRISAVDQDKIDVALFPEAVADCSLVAQAPSIHFEVERMEGEYPLGFDPASQEPSQAVTFSPHVGENYVATQGVIVIDHLGSSDVSIGLVASTQHSDINGRFTASFCR